MEWIIFVFSFWTEFIFSCSRCKNILQPARTLPGLVVSTSAIGSWLALGSCCMNPCFPSRDKDKQERITVSSLSLSLFPLQLYFLLWTKDLFTNLIKRLPYSSKFASFLLLLLLLFIYSFSATLWNVYCRHAYGWLAFRLTTASARPWSFLLPLGDILYGVLHVFKALRAFSIHFCLVLWADN